MQTIARIIAGLPWWFVIAACLTLGLAPFTPEPHVWEKLKMLFSGALTRPIDIVDLVMHAAPWILAAIKLGLAAGGPMSRSNR